MLKKSWTKVEKQDEKKSEKLQSYRATKNEQKLKNKMRKSQKSCRAIELQSYRANFFLGVKKPEIQSYRATGSPPGGIPATELQNPFFCRKKITKKWSYRATGSPPGGIPAPELQSYRQPSRQNPSYRATGTKKRSYRAALPAEPRLQSYRVMGPFFCRQKKIELQRNKVTKLQSYKIANPSI